MTAGRMGMLAGRVKGIPLRIERRQAGRLGRGGPRRPPVGRGFGQAAPGPDRPRQRPAGGEFLRGRQPGLVGQRAE